MSVLFQGQVSSAPDLRDLLTYSWSPTTGFADHGAVITTGDFGLGSKNVTLTVTNKLGESDSDSASFTVRDTTVSVLACPSTITLVADDSCVGTIDFPLAQATDIYDTTPVVTRSPAGNSWSHGDTAVTHTGKTVVGIKLRAFQPFRLPRQSPARNQRRINKVQKRDKVIERHIWPQIL